MGQYKNLKMDLDEIKFDIIDVILIIFVVIFALVSIYFANESNKLLIQVDETMGKYNEVCYQLNQVNNAYEGLKEKYDYAIEIIRTSDKYSLSEGMEE